MSKRKPTLSVEDRKAIDLVLDHTSASSVIARLASQVAPGRMRAVTRLLSLLNELPEIDPPAGLVARTMERIDRDVAERTTRQPSVEISPSAHLHRPH